MTDDLLDERGDVVFSVCGPARAALEFVAATGAFHVRGLPGDLTDDEKVAMVASLVDAGLLRIG